MEKYKIGDRFKIEGEEYILALTSSEDEDYRFQLIGLKSGNRWSDKIVFHARGIHSGIKIERHELVYLLESEDDLVFVDRVIATHKKGYLWEESL